MFAVRINMNLFNRASSSVLISIDFSPQPMNLMNSQQNQITFTFYPLKCLKSWMNRKKIWMNKLQADNLHFQAWIQDLIQFLFSAIPSINLFYAHFGLVYESKLYEMEKGSRRLLFFSSSVSVFFTTEIIHHTGIDNNHLWVVCYGMVYHHREQSVFFLVQSFRQRPMMFNSLAFPFLYDWRLKYTLYSNLWIC